VPARALSGDLDNEELSPTMPLSHIADHLRLVVVTGGAADREPQGARRLLAVLEAALRGGATAVMLREKEMPADRLTRLAADALRLTRAAGAWLIVNDAVDVALAVGADAVHLGWRSEPLESVRARADAVRGTGRHLCIGVSTHTPEEVADAARRGADYATFGPVFPTPSKAGLVAVQGLAGVRAARAAVDAVDKVDVVDAPDEVNAVRGVDNVDATDAVGAVNASQAPWDVGNGRSQRFVIVGLGGIGDARASSVIEAGADGVAVIRAVLGAPDPEGAARRIVACVARGLGARA
jgi:thiamine-phosphate pyrophosphorylase